MNEHIGPFHFQSNFDSANLSSVHLLPTPQTPLHDHSFLLTTNPDASHSPTPTKNKTWFYFSIKMNSDTPQSVLFTIHLNRVQKLFNMGYKPVFRHQSDSQWMPLHTKVFTSQSQTSMELKFVFTFGCLNIDSARYLGTREFPGRYGVYYFAYGVPYSVAQMKSRVGMLEVKFDQRFGCRIPRFVGKGGVEFIEDGVKKVKVGNGGKDGKGKVYFHRDVLCKSNDGFPIDLITVSSYGGIKDDGEVPPSGLFPISGSRARLFDTSASEVGKDGNASEGKSYFVVSARVHPAETISSHMLDGFIDYLTSDERIPTLLRSKFVFKIVPMLNPDGVYRGHYRGDVNGVNLNRKYKDPDPIAYPSIWGITTYVKYLTTLGNVEYYIDLHGHANKHSSFLFGNWINDIQKQSEILRFARFMCINNPMFDYSECNFAPKEMLPGHPKPEDEEKSKFGTGRVQMMDITGSHHCYTFEANYYGTRMEKRQSKMYKCSKDKRFSVQDMHYMGKSILLSVYDMKFPECPSVVEKCRSFEGVEEVGSWVSERLGRLYQSARIPMPNKIAWN